jgi:hypothetical protein
MTGTPTDLPSGLSQASTVRIRRSWWVGLPPFVLPTVMTLNLRQHHEPYSAVLVVLMALTAVLVAVNQWIESTDLTATHLISRWGRRKQAIAWDRVQGFTVNNTLVSRVLKVISDDGKSKELWAPYTSFFIGRARFDAQHNLIGQWWIDHRGPDWRPMPVKAWGDPRNGPSPFAVPSPPRPAPWIKLKRPD